MILFFQAEAEPKKYTERINEIEYSALHSFKVCIYYSKMQRTKFKFSNCVAAHHLHDMFV